MLGKYSALSSRANFGFTVVELLIVIVVVGILAAIISTAYSGVQARANDNSVQADLSTISKKMQLFHVDNERYPSSAAELASLGININNVAYATTPSVAANLPYCTKPNYSGYAIFAMTKSGVRYVLRETGPAAVDTTGLAWGSSTTNLASLCGALASGYSLILSHGYFASDTATGPWRGWTGGN